MLPALVGALAALACSPAWPMLAAMLAGMVLGMIVSFVLSTLFGIVLGAFELMIPVMLSGMVSGMVLSMQASAGPLETTAAAQLGALIGLGCYAYTAILNLFLRGEAKRWTS